MTFRELYIQAAKDTGYNIPTELARDILVNAIRISIEELMAKPESAEINIAGIVRFYLNRKKFTNKFGKKSAIENLPNTLSFSWVLGAKAYKPLKEVLNNKRDHRELLIGGSIPLYPEYMFENGIKKKCKGGTHWKIVPPDFKRKYTVVESQGYITAWRRYKKQMELEKNKGKLPEEE